MMGAPSNPYSADIYHTSTWGYKIRVYRIELAPKELGLLVAR